MCAGERNLNIEIPFGSPHLPPRAPRCSHSAGGAGSDGGQCFSSPLDFERHVRAPPGVLVIKFRNPVVNGLSTTFVELRGALVPPWISPPRKTLVRDRFTFVDLVSLLP